MDRWIESPYEVLEVGDAIFSPCCISRHVDLSQIGKWVNSLLCYYIEGSRYAEFGGVRQRRMLLYTASVLDGVAENKCLPIEGGKWASSLFFRPPLE